MQLQSTAGRHRRQGLLFRGVIAILFGILAIGWPGITLAILILLFGAYAIIDGIFDIVTAVRGSAFQSRELLLVEGIVSIVAGAIAFIWPGITALVFIYLLAAWAVVTGVMEIVAAFSLARDVSVFGEAGGSDWWLALAGAASILFGILIALQPRFGLLSVIWFIGIYALIFGVLFIIRFFQSRSLAQTTTRTPGSHLAS